MQFSECYLISTSQKMGLKIGAQSLIQTFKGQMVLRIEILQVLKRQNSVYIIYNLINSGVASKVPIIKYINTSPAESWKIR